jgi:peptidoglycan/xylan/chitin deacetylase (PgdA/CDA1 family)
MPRHHFPTSAANRRAILGLTAIALFTVWALLVGAGTARASGQTIVSLTFDDGTATQYQARSMLASHGMKATFFINSGKWSQLDDLVGDGNEIGGHTVHHLDLTKIDPVEAQRQVCKDRATLLSHGYPVRNFAYPFGGANAAAQGIVQNCGYNSGRSTATFNSSCTTCAESIPPQNPYATRVAAAGVTLGGLQDAVTKAEQTGGGWVQIVLHQICDGCEASAISASTLSSFLDWLQPRSANGTVVRTVGDVIGGSVQPAVQPPPSPDPPFGTNALRNASLEQGGQTPDCWNFDSYGNNTYTWTHTPDAHSGSYAERVDVSNYVSGASTLIAATDLGFCAPSVTPGHRYRVTAWYKSSAPVRFTSSTRDAVGGYYFWSLSPSFSASSQWTQATWVTPVVPSGATGASIGLTLPSNGSMVVDDLSFDDVAAPPPSDSTAPIAGVTAPADGSTVAGTVTLSANASDNVAIDRIEYLVDGSVISSDTSGPFSISWNSRTVPNGTHSIAVRAVDTAGNATTSAPVIVTVGNASSINLLQNASLETASGTTPTCWLLGGFGTNTFSWTRTSDAHSGAFAERLDMTSWTSGDRKLVSSQDSGLCAPAATAGHTYTVTAHYKSNVQPRFFAYYRSATGVWTFWSSATVSASPSGWTQASWSTPPVPSGATHLSVGMGLSDAGSLTMDDFSLYDNAVPPDTTAPTSSITCDSSACSSGWYANSVGVALSASDEAGGSGVKEIRYTTDGSDPTATSGSVYNGSFNVSSSTTVKYRAFDYAGNAEAVKSQQIRIDTTSPTVAVTAPDDGAIVNGSVDLTASASDAGSGVARVDFLVDGQLVGSDTSAPFSYSWDSSAVADGIHVIRARAVDVAANATTSAANSVTVGNAPPPDTTAPTSSIECSSSACSDGWYTNPVGVALSASDEAGGSGVKEIRYTTDGSDPTASSGTVYDGSFTVSSTTTVRYRAFDNAGNGEAVNSQRIRIDTAAPASSIRCNASACSDGWYANPVGVSLSGTDEAGGSGVKEIRYTTDGSDPTASSGTVYDGSFTVSSTTTVRYRAFDNAGNGEAVGSQQIRIDTATPGSSIRCNAGACSSGWYTDPVGVSLSGTDQAGGSGVKEIRYTTDGSDPTATSGNLFSDPFSLSSTTTVRYRAFDNAGNAEAVNSQLIRIDTAPPTVAITAPTNNSTITGTVKVTANASDGGSGVAKVTFYLDGSVLSTVTAAPYTTPWNTKKATKGTHTLTAVAADTAGNSTTSAAVTVTVR